MMTETAPPDCQRHANRLCSLLTCNACSGLRPDSSRDLTPMRRRTWRAYHASPCQFMHLPHWSSHTHLLLSHGFICSPSRKANCWDNAVAQRFFLNVKAERVWQRHYANHAEARIAIVADIVGFYNSEGLHSVLEAIVCLPSTNGKWQPQNLSIYLQLLDHHN